MKQLWTHRDRSSMHRACTILHQVLCMCITASSWCSYAINEYVVIFLSFMPWLMLFSFGCSVLHDFDVIHLYYFIIYHFVMFWKMHEWMNANLATRAKVNYKTVIYPFREGKTVCSLQSTDSGCINHCRTDTTLQSCWPAHNV